MQAIFSQGIMVISVFQNFFVCSKLFFHLNTIFVLCRSHYQDFKWKITCDSFGLCFRLISTTTSFDHLDILKAVIPYYPSNVLMISAAFFSLE